MQYPTLQIKTKRLNHFPLIPPNQTRFSTPKPSQILPETSWNSGRTAYVQGQAIGSGIPHKESANIHQYVQVEHFQCYLTSSASSAPNFLKPTALDSPGELLSVSIKLVQNPTSRRGDIGKTPDGALYWPGYLCNFHNDLEWKSPFPFRQRP